MDVNPYAAGNNSSSHHGGGPALRDSEAYLEGELRDYYQEDHPGPMRAPRTTPGGGRQQRHRKPRAESFEDVFVIDDL